MKTLSIFISIIFLGFISKVQGQCFGDELMSAAEVMPEPVGGMDAFQKYVAKKLKYPKEAQKAGIEGTVYVCFWVKVDGTTTDFRIVRRLGYGLDEEALRLIQAYPKGWKPGQQRGKPVNVAITIPVKFVLNANPKKKQKNKE